MKKLLSLFLILSCLSLYASAQDLYILNGAPSFAKTDSTIKVSGSIGGLESSKAVNITVSVSARVITECKLGSGQLQRLSKITTVSATEKLMTEESGMASFCITPHTPGCSCPFSGSIASGTVEFGDITLWVDGSQVYPRP